MTNAEWMAQMMGRFGASEADAELILVNQGIDADETVDVRAAKTALVKEFATIIPMANVTEGGYSISWNMEAVKMWYNAACSELGIEPSTTPRIRNRSNMW